MGSYMPIKLGDLSVLCMKSELHLNQDGKRTGDGTATLPVKDFFDQIIDDANPKVFLTIGTSGSVFQEFGLGDSVISRAAKFRLKSEFRNETFNGQTYRSDWQIPAGQLDTAVALMQPFGTQLREPAFEPPTKRYHYQGGLITTDPNTPRVRIEQGSRDMPEFHPILTTDYFEFGTSANHLEQEGCAVEMGDAVLGMAIEARGGSPEVGGGTQHVRPADQRRPANGLPARPPDGVRGGVLHELRLLHQRGRGIGDVGGARWAGHGRPTRLNGWCACQESHPRL